MKSPPLTASLASADGKFFSFSAYKGRQSYSLAPVAFLTSKHETVVLLSSSHNYSFLGCHEELHRGNGFLSGWESRKVENQVGWRYFPVTLEALKLWKDALKSGKLKLTSAANG